MICKLVNDELYIPMKEKELAMLLQVSKVESDDLLCSEALLNIDFLCAKAHYKTCNAAGDYPAPPDSPAIGEVDEGMADESDEDTCNWSEEGSHKCQETILDGNCCVWNWARNSNKSSKDEEESGTDSNGDNCNHR